MLGFDIFLDDLVKPWLIEVNSLASFATDSPLDKKVKYDLMMETMTMLNLSPKRKKKSVKQKQEKLTRSKSRENTGIANSLKAKSNKRDALRR